MAHTDSFFNTSRYLVSNLTPLSILKPNVVFTASFYISDLLKGDTATNVSSTFSIKSGRDEVVLTDTPIWTAPASQPALDDLQITLTGVVGFVTAGEGSEAQVLATAVSTLDVAEATIVYTIDDITNYNIDSETGEVTLTAAGVTFVDLGNQLPAYVITATSDTGATGSTETITPLTAEDTVTPKQLNAMWPTNVWAMDVTVADAAWDGEKELIMNMVLTDSDGVTQSYELILHKG